MEYNRRNFIKRIGISTISGLLIQTLPFSLSACEGNGSLKLNLKEEEKMLKLGMFVFDGFELLDVFGPLEMLGSMHLKNKIQIFLISEKSKTIESSAGPVVVADYQFENAPEMDILMIPGGSGTRREVNNEYFVSFFKKMAENASHVATVCTGSAVLARTGLIDGLRATTNKRAFKWVMSQGPNVRWVKQARWVEDGKYFTSSGISAGIDMSLALISKLYGKDLAIKIAQGAEYEWQMNPNHDPFAKLNGLIP